MNKIPSGLMSHARTVGNGTGKRLKSRTRRMATLHVGGWMWEQESCSWSPEEALSAGFTPQGSLTKRKGAVPLASPSVSKSLQNPLQYGHVSRTTDMMP